jgi:hypothetical protein
VSSEVEDTDSSQESKQKEWHFPRLVELRYPIRIAKTQDRHNWIASMMVDGRLNDRDKLILTRLAMHLNLKTVRCDPPVGLLVFELSIGGSERNAIRSVRRSLERSERLGWIRRHLRHGGDARHNQSNLYTLTIPPDILAMLHPPIGQKAPPDRANDPSREGCTAPLIGKSLIGKIEYSDLSDRHRPLARTGALQVQSIHLKEGATGEEGYSEDALSLCEHFFHNFAYRPRSFGALRSFCQQNNSDITFGELAALVRAGRVKQSRDGYWMDEDDQHED